MLSKSCGYSRPIALACLAAITFAAAALPSRDAWAQSYQLQHTIVADSAAYWLPGQHTTTVTVKNIGPPLPANMQFYIDNRQVLPAGYSLSFVSATVTAGGNNYAITSCTFTVYSPYGNATGTTGPQTKCTGKTGTAGFPTNATFKVEFKVQFAGPSALTTGRSNGSIDNYWNCSYTYTEPSTASWPQGDTACVATIPWNINIQKIAPTPPVTVGVPTTFTLKVKNIGAGPVGGIATGTPKVLDTLPSGMTFVSAAGTNWNCGNTGQNVFCDYNLNGGVRWSNQTVGGDITITAIPTTAGIIQNCATTQTILYLPPAGATSFMPGDTQNNTSCVKYTVLPKMDVRLAKTGGGLVAFGATTTFTLSSINVGPGPVAGGQVKITDTLPTSLSNITASGGPNWTCGVVVQVVTCTYATAAPTVQAGSAFPNITITAKAVTSGSFQNCAQIALLQGTDTQPTDNNACAPFTVGPGPKVDVAIAKLLENATPVKLNQLAAFLLKPSVGSGSSAVGGSTGIGVTVIDNLPANFGLPITWTPTGTTPWQCSLSPTSGTGPFTVTCVYNGPVVPPGAQMPGITIKATAKATGNYINRATVTAPGFVDFNPNNNTYSLNGTVTP